MGSGVTDGRPKLLTYDGALEEAGSMSHAWMSLMSKKRFK
jgi:hypothetical protein